MSVATVILAAGLSRRMGAANKLLAPFAGKPMLCHVVDHALEARTGPVFVVTGHEAGRIEQVLRGLAVQFIENEDYESGLASSVGCGIRHLPGDVTAALILLGDMPLVKADTMKKLVTALGDGDDAVVPVYEKKRGNPVLWHRRMFPALSVLSGDRGARRVLATMSDRVRYLDVDDPGILMDADDPDDLLHMQSNMRQAVLRQAGRDDG